MKAEVEIRSRYIVFRRLVASVGCNGVKNGTHDFRVTSLPLEPQTQTFPP
jgi:hypothetical protein